MIIRLTSTQVIHTPQEPFHRHISPPMNTQKSLRLQQLWKIIFISLAHLRYQNPLPSDWKLISLGNSLDVNSIVIRVPPVQNNTCPLMRICLWFIHQSSNYDLIFQQSEEEYLFKWKYRGHCFCYYFACCCCWCFVIICFCNKQNIFIHIIIIFDIFFFPFFFYFS